MGFARGRGEENFRNFSEGDSSILKIYMNRKVVPQLIITQEFRIFQQLTVNSNSSAAAAVRGGAEGREMCKREVVRSFNFG